LLCIKKSCQLSARGAVRMPATERYKRHDQLLHAIAAAPAGDLC
jgi:hypothetical protein